MEEISILPLGAGCEVSRWCIILTINKKKIMLDCGLMIGRSGREALPLFEKVNAEELSMILITHAHIDHCGALPYYLSSTKYSGRVYMTQPTKDIYKYLLKDSLKVRIE
jgi:cleavage and polyadenylation specificity factor subunit 3